MKSETAFVDIDTQRDFMRRDGALYVKGAEEIVPNLKRLVALSRKKGFWLLSSADAHTPDDPEFKQFPPHCVAGTPGQSKIAETTTIPYLVVKNRAGALSAVRRTAETQLIFEKQDFDVMTNPNFLRLIKEKGLRRFVVFGVATDYCVRAASLALRKEGLEVTVVSDAIRPVDAEKGRRALEEMKRAGVKFETTEAVVSSFEER